MKLIYSVLLVVIFLMSGLMLLVYMFQEKLIFLPSKLPDDFQFKFDAPFQEVFLNPEKGVIINALHFKVEDPKGIVLYFHGNAGDLSNWGYVATVFTNLGYEVWVPDYRSYGKSKGPISEEGLYRDADFFYSKILEDHTESEIVIYGRSIGTGIASYLGSKNNPGRLVLESPFYSLPDLASQLIPMIPSFLMRYQFPINEYLSNVQCPVYLIHGTEDEIIKHNSSIRLQALLKPQDELILINGGRHNDLSLFDEYYVILARILK